MNILDQILEVKHKELQARNPRISEFKPFNHVRSLTKALEGSDISVIAEIKMKSPSEGDIFPDADPVQIAKDYESAGASAISVLTDKQFFGGSLEILESVRKAVSIPVLRKDFIIGMPQILDAAFAKADAYLLITEVLPDSQMTELFTFGNTLGLESIVEFHDPDNIPKIEKLNPSIIGVNCRDLKTMWTDITYFKKMIAALPPGSIKVAESGIYSSDDLNYVADLGYDAALVGTSLMKTGAPGKALEQLLGGLT
ncbi:MAG: indole-3-glycerol phosphate synthase TrpC [Fidelibacterota bacterium]